MKSIAQQIAIISLTIITAGCANTSARYEPIVDGNPGALYTTDLTACQSLATKRLFINDDVKSEVVMGAVTGAILSGADDGWDGVLPGAIVGSMLGGGTRAWETRGERKNIVIECMRQRGHRVVG